MGSRITYYTENGIYEIAVNLPVPEKSYQDISAIVDGEEKQVTVVQTEDGSTVSYDFSKLDLSDTGTFPNGGMDAYLVTAGGETELVGDKTLSRWVGTWESWETYLDPSGTAGIQYPYLNQVWQLAYQAYMAAFQSAGIDMSATMPDVATLQAYWKILPQQRTSKRLRLLREGAAVIPFNGGMPAGQGSAAGIM